jgi:hypothetical protein
MSGTLQKEVFKKEGGYLGTTPGLQLRENFAKSLQACTPFGGRLATNWRCVESWATRISQVFPNSYGRLILSNEVLSTSNRFTNRPIIDFLARFQKTVWPQGRIKALLILRNQPARLASGYAQSSQSRVHPSQSDFEQHVEKFLRRRGHLLDYAAWVDGLRSVLGKKTLACFL